MLKIEIVENHCDITFQGDPVEIACEVGIAMGGIYNSFKQEDRIGAEVFRSGLLRVMEPGCPTWEPQNGATMVKLPAKKEGGAPTDQS